MDINDLLGDGTATVMWRGKFPVRIRPMSGEMERKAQSVMTPQWKGHNRMEEKVDPVKLRDFYCTHIVVAIDGLTMGQNGSERPFGMSVEDRCELWDKTPDFRTFVVQAASDAANFEREKND